MREVGVHNDDEVATRVLQAVDIGCSEAEFASASVELYAVTVGFDKLFGDGLRAVRRAIVDDYDFPVEFAGKDLVGREGGWCEQCVLLGEHLLEQPYYDWEVVALVVGGKQDGVFVVLRHTCGCSTVDVAARRRIGKE